MQKTTFNLGMPYDWLPKRMLLVMKLIIIMLTTCLMQVSAASFGQRLTLVKQNVSLKEVFREIRQQTGYNVLWPSEKLDAAKTVDANFREKQLSEVLDELLKGQSLGYSIDRKTVRIAYKEPSFLDKVVDAFTPPEDAEGVVLDEKGNPLPGATVRVKGTKNVVITDSKGHFYLIRPDYKDKLIISYVGYIDKEVAIEENITVRLELKSAELNEVVVAYGRQQQKSITGAVTVVKGEQIQSLPNRSVDKSLQGMVPGLVVTKGTGQPGSNVSNFVLRGIATGGDPSLGNPVRNPLFVIDGIPVTQRSAMKVYNDNDELTSNPLAHLNPSDIESISVLKDASAIALYGSKASNGVILVTTKKGKAGRTQYSFRHQTEIANREDNGVKLLNQQQYIDLFVETYQNSFPTATRAEVLDLLKTQFPVQSNGDFYPGVDWVNALSNKNARTSSNELSISGGNEKSNFYMNLENTGQKGVIKKSSFERSSFRLNYEYNPHEWLKYGFNTSLSYNVQEFPTAAALQGELMSPLNPIYTENGDLINNYTYGSISYPGTLTPSPYAVLELNINRNRAYRALSKGFIESKFLKYFTISTAVGFDFMLNDLKTKIHPDLAIDGDLSKGGRLHQQYNKAANIINSNILSFNKIFDELHSVNILAGQEVQIQSTVITDVRGDNFGATNPTLEDAQGQGSETTEKQNQVSYFSQVNYGFKSRYFLTGSIRADGSSQFGENNRFGTYWSAGAAYVVSEEPFFKKLGNWANFMKVRGSFGPAGNSAAINNSYRLNRILLVNFLGNNALVPPVFGENWPGNPSIKWEETFTWDAGFELRGLNNRMSFIADIYQRKTKNFLAFVPLPNSGGGSSVFTNIGDIKNSGIELSLSATPLQFKSAAWNITANWSRNRNRLTKSFYPELAIGGYLINKVGEEYNSFYLPVWAGVNPVNGRPQWLDASGNPSEDYGEYQTIVGKSQPDGTGAVTNTFSFKGFSLSAMFYFQYGSKILTGAQTGLVNDGENPYNNQGIRAVNHWRNPGDSSPNPRRLFQGNVAAPGEPPIFDYGILPSTRYLFNGDFIRLSNVALNYSVPKAWLEKMHLKGLKLYVQGSNLALWTKYSSGDPENINVYGIGGGTLYPQQRTYTLGLNLTL